MSAISLKSITGITSITTPTGVDNQLTLHTNDTTQRVKVTQSGIEVVGVATFQDVDVDGHTNLDNVSNAGDTTHVGNVLIPNDTGKILLGASQDLQFYHDFSGGSENSHIAQTTNKHLQITAYTTFNRITGTWGVIKESNSHNIIRATAGSDVKLYFNNGEKLATAGHGINITGGFVATGDCSIADKITHAGDENTSIRFPAADTFTVETAGSERLRITSGGSVNIGTNNLTQTTFKSQIETGTNKFISFGNAAHDDLSNEGSGIIFSRPSDGAKSLSGIFQHTTQSLGMASRADLTFHAGGTSTYSAAPERLRIDSSGNVLIGTTATSIYNDSSGEGIVLRGGDCIDIARSGDNQLYLNRQSSDGYHIAFIRDGSYKSFIATRSNAFCIDVNSAERLRITEDGEVGINKSTPNAGVKLHVGGTARFDDDVSIASTKKLFTNSSQGQLTIQGGATYPGSAIKFAGGQSGATDQGQMIFYAGTATSLEEKLRITSGGSVNIGGDYTSTTSRLRINSTSYPETTEYLAVFKAGVANGNRFKNRYIKIRNNYTGSIHGGVPIVWEANADASNNKAYGAVVTEGNGDIRFLNAAATSEKAIGTDLLSTISEKLRITSGGVVKIGGDVSNSSADVGTVTKLTIKQHTNTHEGGLYIERSGERRGYYMYVGGAGGHNDALCITSNQLGTDTNILAIDRGNRLAKLGGDVVIDSTNNGYGGLRIYDDSAGDYNIHYIAGRNQGATAHVFSMGGRSQNQSPWATTSASEIARLTHTNGLSFQGDTNTFIGKYTQDSQGDHLRVVTNGLSLIHI